MLKIVLFIFFIFTTLYSQEVIHLWKNGAPGFEQLKNEPEQAKDYWVKNINNPSITVYLPEKPNKAKAGVLICPGGGFKELVFNAEGVDAAKYFNSIGVAAFILKYRLPREENSPYNWENVKEDAHRAIRLIRSKSKNFGIEKDNLGMMGFSAGGEVVSSIAFENGITTNDIMDIVDKENGQPNFLIYVYPGPMFIPENIPTNAPPAFLIAAIDDEYKCDEFALNIFEQYQKNELSAEIHIYSKGKHAFNMGQRTTLKTIKDWPNRLEPWMYDNDILK